MTNLTRMWLEPEALCSVERLRQRLVDGIRQNGYLIKHLADGIGRTVHFYLRRRALVNYSKLDDLGMPVMD